ncbi:glycoside hydrolase family 3 protein [Rarobacter faecitabidus]|uniref:Beta-N-acetylhexosaminidase n=1 Tax=Rarobacter faecitabidus TaxID=13243 RepID=A0A542ZX06_RARFA|nr:glycoside hydrolase family 3 N-terminal domain-containing protein [Rarobacter faecitabidus]TQL64884.1 beta-N-acetylhexosaminidase [Rarobacter faecitabidus]
MSDHALRRDILATLQPGFTGHVVPEWVMQGLADGIESVCVYGENVRDAEQLGAIGSALREADRPILVAIDEEGGDVTRLHYREGSPYPGAAILGRIDDVELTASVASQVARDVLAAGFNLILGPVADVNSNPLNPVIGTRSFSADPQIAARHVAAWVAGAQAAGAVACVKHFPGHGDTSADSHLGLPTISVPANELATRELVPFRAAIEAGVKAVMTSHIVVRALDATAPATFSRAIVTDLLRGELGFTGIVVSDALDMQGASAGIGIPRAAVRALAAGCDLLCLGTGTTPALVDEIAAEIEAAIERGGLTLGRVSEAAARVRATIAELPTGIGEEEVSAGPDVEQVIEAFDGVDAAGEWIARHREAWIVRADSEANMAVGDAPWGPFTPDSRRGWLSERPLTSVDAEASSPWQFDERPPAAIVIGRGITRPGAAADRLRELTASGIPTLVVEMGWPSVFADAPVLATYGASRLVGDALIHLLEAEAVI